ncbi:MULTISPECIES: nitrite reductase (NAD(P)H) small subunit family protein [unclassified Halomonas]|uniref:nitrite reductase (NAD(P)H) small subunit family protein n=1 Tax=unclassified Halomonas TaxID=2609666 RepID=UPI0024694108|nr:MULTISPECIES: nitrite reductase (NAD(P)H) small subunit family protein [unclassified Halomonas]
MTTATATNPMTQTWQRLCHRADLVPFSGVAAWVETAEGPAQVAIFYIPCGPNTPQPAGPNTPEGTLPGPNTPGEAGHESELYAIDHHDPIAGANVNARGIVGDLKGQPVVASPLYKHHYRLTDGQCLENPGLRLRTWAVSFHEDRVMIRA